MKAVAVAVWRRYFQRENADAPPVDLPVRYWRTAIGINLRRVAFKLGETTFI